MESHNQPIKNHKSAPFYLCIYILDAFAAERTRTLVFICFRLHAPHAEYSNAVTAFSGFQSAVFVLERLSELETLMHVGIESPRQKPLSDSTCVCFPQLPPSVVHWSFALCNDDFSKQTRACFTSPMLHVGRSNAIRSTCCINCLI